MLCKTERVPAGDIDIIYNLMSEHAAVNLKPHLMGCRLCRHRGAVGESCAVEEGSDSDNQTPSSAGTVSEISAVGSAADTAEPADLQFDTVHLVCLSEALDGSDVRTAGLREAWGPVQ